MHRVERARPTRSEDADALRRFACSTGPWYEDEVQNLVRGVVADRVASGDRAWVVEDVDGEIAAIAGHEGRPHPAGTGTTITYLAVIATRVDDRDGGFRSARRLTQVLKAVFAEVLASDREPLCYVMVAVDNARMRAFCEHSGFVAGPVPAEPEYLFYTARLRDDSATT